MKPIFDLLRVKQWVKNLFLLIPAFFAGTLFDFENAKVLLLGVVCFSFIASSVYIINDYRDRHHDLIHPLKKNRPIASGKVSLQTAIFVFAFLAITGLTFAFYIDRIFFFLVLFYLILNMGYSFGLKNVPILDLFIVASGFLIRVHSGGILSNVPVSQWLSIMILLLALFIIIAKRRDDLVLQDKIGVDLRKVSKSYNLEFTNSCMTLLSAIILVAYIMYTVSPEVTDRFNNQYLYTTTIFVMAGIMRYLQITFVEKKSGSPTEILLKDKFILITILGWIITFYFLIYF
ncbi:MAG: UbiA prenyltransferase family protein [Cyclobacteriaceae bacterium]|nr:UbiA prenyltransferase family protein [Cyclobacteriaceae bacterium]